MERIKGFKKPYKINDRRYEKVFETGSNNFACGRRCVCARCTDNGTVGYILRTTIKDYANENVLSETIDH